MVKICEKGIDFTMFQFKDFFKPKINIYKNIPQKLNIDNPKKVSVVIPNYNYENYIIERIDSIVNQTYPIYELIIIDDCSKDNSVAVIEKKIKKLYKKFPNLKIEFIKNDVNSGNVFCGWQRAFSLSTGDYLWIAEADDSCSPIFLETIMNGFQSEDTVISYCESLTMDEKNIILMNDLRVWIDIFKCGKWEQDYHCSGLDELSSTMCINNTIANVSSVVFKKLPNIDYDNLLKTAQTFRLAGDWYFYSKILEYGSISYFRESLNYHRMQKKSVTLTTSGAQEFEEICRMQDYILNAVDVSEDIKKLVYQRRENERRRFGLE